jgi:hypothetical protein
MDKVSIFIVLIIVGVQPDKGRYQITNSGVKFDTATGRAWALNGKELGVPSAKATPTPKPAATPQQYADVPQGWIVEPPPAPTPTMVKQRI